MDKIKIIIILIFCIFLTGCQDEVVFENSSIEEKKSIINVDIKGAVKFPGVYEVEENTMLLDLINLAGGLNEDADVSNINLVLTITENQMITIPFKDMTSSLININVASTEELMKLPGIGEAKANKIIEYREKTGMFTSVEQLRKVSGISEELYNQIKELIRV